MNKDTAVIILNWNGAELLRRFLPSVIANTDAALADVIVADNGSTDNSLEVLRTDFPDVKVLAYPDNRGYAGGYNRAIADTRYKYTVLLNSDVETPAGWLNPLVEYMEAHTDVGACQPKIMSVNEPGKFEYAGAAGGYIDRLGYPYCRGRIFDYIEADHGQYDTPAEVCWASGASLMVRTDVYETVGGLDEKFFAHMEEIDLCCRMHTAGWKVMALPYSKIYHLGGASLAQGNPRKTYLNFRNNLLLLHKSLPVKTGKRRLFIRRLYDTLAWAMFMAKLDFANAGAVLRAHRDFKRMRKEYTEHPDTDTLRSLPGADRNIIIDYYLKHKKK